MASRQETEILVHITAPSRARDDTNYRALASAYLDFEPAGKRSIATVSDLGRARNDEVRGGHDSRQEMATTHAGVVASSAQEQAQTTFSSQELSFSSVLDNLRSPSLRKAQVKKHDAVATSQQSSYPSVVQDSCPDNNIALPNYSSPTRILEYFLSNLDSSQSELSPSNRQFSQRRTSGNAAPPSSELGQNREHGSQRSVQPVRTPITPIQTSSSQTGDESRILDTVLEQVGDESSIPQPVIETDMNTRGAPQTSSGLTAESSEFFDASLIRHLDKAAESHVVPSSPVMEGQGQAVLDATTDPNPNITPGRVLATPSDQEKTGMDTGIFTSSLLQRLEPVLAGPPTPGVIPDSPVLGQERELPKILTGSNHSGEVLAPATKRSRDDVESPNVAGEPVIPSSDYATPSEFPTTSQEAVIPSSAPRADSEPPPAKRQKGSPTSSTSKGLPRSTSDMGPRQKQQSVKPPVPTQQPRRHAHQLEVHAPEPEVGIGETNTSKILTPFLVKLADDLGIERRFRVLSQKRELRPYERGYWLVDCSSWDETCRANAWEYLCEYIRKGLAGWGVWCCRDEDTDWIRVYCWGQVIPHLYFVIYLASSREILFTEGVSWIGGDGEAVVVMQVRERSGHRA